MPLAVLQYFQMEKLKYFRATATNQNHINREVKRISNARNTCHNSVQKLLFSHLLNKYMKIFK
jgi:hypothetical protein